MTTTATPTTPTETAVIECLKHAEANAIAMYLNNKRYHWHTHGPRFRDLHLFFDEMAAAALAEVDPLGERIRMLGGSALSAPREIEAWATVDIAEGHPAPAPDDMLRQALENERRIVRDMREGAVLADRQQDCGTNDLFSTLVQNHEKYAWFIEEFLRQENH
jgi:starvation-inducible DNA-binding protein